MRFVFTILLVLAFNLAYAGDIYVAASANTQYALKEIIKSFNKKYPDINVKLSISSSGKLAIQIQRGAKYDIFLSADNRYPSLLYKKGYTIGAPKVYAKGVLVLWSLKYPIKNIKDLTKLEKIAIANPKTAPYGRAGLEVLKHYKIYDKVKNKLIYGENVGQTSQYIYNKLVDAGFTAKSIVLAPNIKQKGYWIEIDRYAYAPIKQAVVLLKNGQNKEDAKKFFHYLFSKEAQNILMKYGYRIDKWMY